MKKHTNLLNHINFGLALVSTPYLLFNMVATPIFKQQIFLTGL